jgi:hypothetical protein
MTQYEIDPATGCPMPKPAYHLPTRTPKPPKPPLTGYPRRPTLPYRKPTPREE